jgi:hypothetical protein
MINNHLISNSNITVNNYTIIIDINNFDEAHELEVDKYVKIYIKNPVKNIDFFYNRFNFNKNLYNYVIITSKGGFYNSSHLYDTNVTYLFMNENYPKKLYRIIIEYKNPNQNELISNPRSIISNEKEIRSNKYYDNFKDILNKYPKFLLKYDECQICYNDNYVYQIHDNFDHSFCDECLKKVNTCPICREEIIK